VTLIRSQTAAQAADRALAVDDGCNITAKPRHIFEPDAHRFYVEPGWCSSRLFEAGSFGAPRGRVLDPVCGGGRILHAAAAAGFTPIASDIVNRLDRRGLKCPFTICDFLKDSPVRSAWSVACNSPFNHVQEFYERALEIAIYKAAILKRIPIILKHSLHA
jgi:hypothetical protein